MHRVAAVFEETDEIFLLKVDGSTVSGTRLPVPHSYSRIGSALSDSLEIVEDELLLPEMLKLESELDEGDRQKRDERYKKIEPLVTTGERELFSKRTRAALLKRRAEEAGATEVTLRRLLLTYWTFGCNRNALLELRSRAGAPGVERKASQKPTGRPNASIVLFGTTGQPNRITTEVDKRRIRRAMDEYFLKADNNYAVSYERMVTELYKGGDVPEFGTFYYHAKRIASDAVFKRAKAGEQEWREKHGSARGHARDLSDGPCDIYDIDGTPFPQQLVASWIPARAIKNPTLMLCVDRHSLAITGFYDSLQPENWDAYRMCLFNAMTSKRDLLLDLGFKEDEWDLVQAPGGVFFDRGPAITDKAQISLCEELKVEPIWAPPGHPEGKPTVEGMFGKLQNLMAKNPGGYKTSQRRKDQQRKKNAIANAQLSPRRFRYELVKEIIYHNKFTRLPHLLTEDMVADGIPPTPAEMFKWGQRQLVGDRARERSAEEIYFGLLPRHHLAVWNDGVRFKGHAYSSSNLLEYRLQHISVLGKSRSCKTYVYADPLMPSRLYWKSPSGRMEVLLPDEHSLPLLRNQTWLDMEVKRLTELADAQVSRREGVTWSRKNHLSRAQEEIISPALPAAGKKPKVVKEGSLEARRIEQELADRELRKRVSKVVGDAQKDTAQSLAPTPVVKPASSLDGSKRKSILDRMFDD
ncbi:hypothetical protein PQR65_18985 [Paraburkholderia nemoris]|uniref:hypothetical protein n=1 Tax=Paraburkholderia nemoris TaxID=2793076 RepID=UPI0038B849F6